MAGLAEGRHTGRPSALDEEQQAYLEQLADAGTYSIRQLMLLMQVRYPGFGVHPSTMRRILLERSFSGIADASMTWGACCMANWSDRAWARVDTMALTRLMNEQVKRLRRRTILVLNNAAVHNYKVVQARQAR